MHIKYQPNKYIYTIYYKHTYFIKKYIYKNVYALELHRYIHTDSQSHANYIIYYNNNTKEPNK